MLSSLIQELFFCVPESIADAAVVKSGGIKALLANGLSTFFIIVKPVFVMV